MCVCGENEASGMIKEITQMVCLIQRDRTIQTAHLPFICGLSYYAFFLCS